MEKNQILKQLISKYKLSVFNTLEFDYDYSYISALLKSKNFQQYTSETDAEFCERICFLPNGITNLFNAKVRRKQVCKIPEKDKKRRKTKRKVDVNSDEFLFSYMWKKLRMVAIMKHGRRCQCCGQTPSKENGIILNVDHIRSRRYFPELALDIDNLQVLCDQCNHGKGNWLTVDFRE